MRYLWPFLHMSRYLPICLSGSMATKHRCGNQARMVKRSLPVPADTLVWPCWAQTTRKSLNCVCCFFSLLIRPEQPFWGCLHGLNFISLLAEQSKPWPDCLLVSNQAYTHSEKNENESQRRGKNNINWTETLNWPDAKNHLVITMIYSLYVMSS